MSSLAPWAVGVRELVARPASRGRVQGVSRLTAAAPRPWFWALLWTATAAASFLALIPALFDRGPPVYELMHTLGGVAFAACGLVAWHRRPDSAVGRLLAIAGFGILLEPILEQVGSPVASTIAVLFGELWIALFATLILSFVSGGRLTSALDVALVAGFVFGLLVMQFAVLLFLPGEDNVLLAWPDGDVADLLSKIQMAVLAAVSLAVVAVIASRWRSASRPRRRALLPSLAGCLCALLYAVNLTTLILEAPSAALITVLNTALLTVPAALLWGLLRSRLARGGLPDLFRELGTLRGARLEAGLAKALGDPELVRAYRVPDEGS
jgi:hypothetical protein